MRIQTAPRRCPLDSGGGGGLSATRITGSQLRRCRRRRLILKSEVGGGERDLFDRYEKWRRERRVKWRLWKFDMIDKIEVKKQQLKETQFVVSCLKTLAFLRQKLDPIYRVWYWLIERLANFCYGYDDFLYEESKRMWKWSNTYELEIVFWREAVTYFQHMIITVIYLTFVPPSLFRGIILPLVLGYFMHDERLWTSPQAATVYLTAPFRYRLGNSFPLF